MAGVEHVLIVGASRGLGFELTRFAVSGSTRVTAIARPPAPALQELRAKHEGALTVGFADVRSDAELRAAAEGLGDARFDAIVYNAAIHRGGDDILEASADDMLLTLDVNAVGAARAVRHFRPRLSDGGLLAFISSEAGSIASSGRKSEYGYCMSKAALNMLSRLMGNREKALGSGVNVVAIQPGWIRTDMGGPRAHLAPEEAARDVWRLLEKRASAPGAPFVDRLGEPLDW
jgi:NAD(P)-dependent dehydrogenase (short-subunit alcohol dehydrogenase family)